MRDRGWIGLFPTSSPTSPWGGKKREVRERKREIIRTQSERLIAEVSLITEFYLSLAILQSPPHIHIT